MIELDKVQKEIVNSNESQILVIAGSGSGKTRVLTERIKRLIEDGVKTDGIVAITFTNAAADEMKERLGNIIGNAYIGTIHGFANKILLSNGISTVKYIEDEDFDEFFELIKNNDITFPFVEHLLVDEFQDISQKENEFFNLLNPANIMVVGDDYQNIFSFRSADVSIFLDMARDEKTKVYMMTTNYRSGAEIVEFASDFMDLVEDKIYKRAICMNNSGEVIRLKNFNKSFIIDAIKSNDSYGDWFILTRTNSQIDFVGDILSENDIPWDSFKKGDLSTDELRRKIKENTVKVLTIHSAKGLENKNVIVLGVKPFSDEERRVAYVAATRAKDLLIWIRNLKNDKTPKIKKWE